MYLTARVRGSRLSDFGSGASGLFPGYLGMLNTSLVYMRWFVCCVRRFVWVSFALILFNQSAQAVRDQWFGRCYEATSLNSPEQRDLGPCQAFIVSSGYSRVIRGVELRGKRRVFGWSDADSDIFTVDGKPGKYEVERGRLPYRLYRYKFCIGDQISRHLTCFVPD